MVWCESARWRLAMPEIGFLPRLDLNYCDFEEVTERWRICAGVVSNQR